MSLRRRSHGPADGIPHVWQCHCGPERTLSKSVHCLRPVEGRFTLVSATKSRLCTLCYGTQTPVHPQYCVEGAEKREPVAPRIPAQSYERSYSALRLCTLSCESRDPMSRGKPQRGKELARRPSNNRRATAHSAERQEAVRRGLRILARMIARAHLRRLAARSGTAPEPPAEGEDAD